MEKTKDFNEEQGTNLLLNSLNQAFIVLSFQQLIATIAAPIAYAIRVDFNTNTGPIVPPTTTPRPVPQPPFRDPAPVWEEQANDVPNPNPY